MCNTHKRNELYGIAKFVLFVTSYIPLFVLIVFKQIFENMSFLSSAELNIETIGWYIQKFGISIFLIAISIISLLLCICLFKNLEKASANGDNVTIINVNNKNNESISYITTYILPFLYQGLSGWYESIAFIFLMIIIYRIYINSNMILINPILSMKYSVFQIEYTKDPADKQNIKIRNALVISKQKDLSEDDHIKIYNIGNKMFYHKIKNKI